MAGMTVADYRRMGFSKKQAERFVATGTDPALVSIRDPFSGISGGLKELFSSLVNRLTGAGLTGAEREANEFTASQTQAQMDFQERMANTQWQRGVEDMQAAGLNPALAYNQGGAVAPSGAAGSSVSPSSGMSMSDLVALATLRPQIDLIKAQERKTNEEAVKTRVEAEKTRKDVEWLDVLNTATVDQIRAATNLAKSEYRLNENERKALLIAEEIATNNRAALDDKEAFYQEWRNRYISETGVDPSSSAITNMFDSMVNMITSSLEKLFPKAFNFTFNNMDPSFHYRRD